MNVLRKEVLIMFDLVFRKELNRSLCISQVKVEKVLKGRLDSISSPSVKIQIMGRKVAVDNAQQCFDLLLQLNFPVKNMNFH